jgi:CO/xanthine dehydrogenase Mo-binding subunit
VIPQIAADALGVPVGRLHIVGPDTHLTPDCGRTSASRQTFVTGRAAFLAGSALCRRIRELLKAAEGADKDAADASAVGSPEIAARKVAAKVEAPVLFGPGWVGVGDARLSLSELPIDARGYALCAEERFDPPTRSLDASGQGRPYATYAFGAQMAEVTVDLETGRVRVCRVVAAHDVGRQVNPTLLEGQVEGAVAQGVGLALMEQYQPGRNNNLHDYLIPTVHDMPVVETLFVEAPTPIGPYGAKGIGEPALVPTAAAILNAIHHATGARVREAPATPDVVLRALAAAGRGLPSSSASG